MSSNPSREARIYLALWRKAYLERDSGKPPLEIQASSETLSIAMRLGLYRAIRPYRTGKLFDEDLRRAAEGFVISPEERDGKYFLILKPRMTLSELEAQMASIGLDDEDLLLEEERLAKKSLEELLPATPAGPPVRSNPFYTRD